MLYCVHCKSKDVIRSGVVTRDFHSVPVGGKPVVLRMAVHLNLSWNTVKEMVKGYLERNYSKPDISDLKVIGIDEFAVKKGHVYKTIVTASSPISTNLSPPAPWKASTTKSKHSNAWPTASVTTATSRFAFSLCMTSNSLDLPT